MTYSFVSSQLQAGLADEKEMIKSLGIKRNVRQFAVLRFYLARKCLLIHTAINANTVIEVVLLDIT